MGKKKQLDVRTLALTQDDITGRVREGWRIVIPAVVDGAKINVGGRYEVRGRGFVIPLKVERTYGKGRRVAHVGKIGYDGQGVTH